jgi:hypothetical protein
MGFPPFSTSFWSSGKPHGSRLCVHGEPCLQHAGRQEAMPGMVELSFMTASHLALETTRIPSTIYVEQHLKTMYTL